MKLAIVASIIAIAFLGGCSHQPGGLYASAAGAVPYGTDLGGCARNGPNRYNDYACNHQNPER